MKKIFALVLTVIILVCTGCSFEKYDYSNWEKYEFPNNEHSFCYPKTWKPGATENRLLYFYENDEQENKIIMAFQSHIDLTDENFNSDSVESNALSDAFKGIKSVHYETGPAAYTIYGTDLVSVDSNEMELKYIEFNPQPVFEQEIAEGDSYKMHFYKMYFSDEVSDKIFWQIYHSCE